MGVPDNDRTSASVGSEHYILPSPSEPPSLPVSPRSVPETISKQVTVADEGVTTVLVTVDAVPSDGSRGGGEPPELDLEVHQQYTAISGHTLGSPVVARHTGSTWSWAADSMVEEQNRVLAGLAGPRSASLRDATGGCGGDDTPPAITVSISAPALTGSISAQHSQRVRIAHTENANSVASSMRSSATISPQVERQVSHFQLTSPDILRATTAGIALGWLGAMFRKESTEGTYVRKQSTKDSARKQDSNGSRRTPTPQSFKKEYYDFSWPSNSIQDFWSHSWRSARSSKVLTLLFLYNGMPAAVLANLAAFGGMVVACFGQASNSFGERDVPILRLGGETHSYSILPQTLGVLVFASVLLLWRSERLVFLDKACIHQSDATLKQAGIDSIGGILKYSDQMVVLWDKSYVRRLWCVFEVAAFIKTHNDKGKVGRRLRFRPIELGWVLLAFFIITWLTSVMRMFIPTGARRWLVVGVWGVGWLVPAWQLHAYRRDLALLSKDLACFTVARAECFCCCVEHIDPTTGLEVPCDRNLVESCIEKWFGEKEELPGQAHGLITGIDAFEKFAHSDLVNIFRDQLSRSGLPYRFSVLATLPMLWWQMESLAAHLNEGNVDVPLGIGLVLSSIESWLCGGPLTLTVITWLVDQGDLKTYRSQLFAALFGAVGGAAFAWLLPFLHLKAWSFSYTAFGFMLAAEVLVTAFLYCPRRWCELDAEFVRRRLAM